MRDDMMYDKVAEIIGKDILYFKGLMNSSFRAVADSEIPDQLHR